MLHPPDLEVGEEAEEDQSGDADDNGGQLGEFFHGVESSGFMTEGKESDFSDIPSTPPD